jgi:8-oxo-dGTP pyrophosphatase MutT (NUDIX family)
VLSHPFIHNIKLKLKEPLPGIEAQFEMAHIRRPKTNISELIPGNYRTSAVLLLLIKRENDFFIPLTERHTYEGAHSGQISLPGGKQEDQDVTLEQTALRECYEEIGLNNHISILGQLTPVYIPVSKFLVNPYVGLYTQKTIDYNLNPSEVKSLIELGTSDLAKPELLKQTTVQTAPGIKLKTPYFDVQGKIVWGATAMILNEFKKLL